MIIRINGLTIEGSPAEAVEFVKLFSCADQGEPVSAGVPEEDTSKPVRVKPNPRKRKAFDVGKAKALRDAGWSVAKIADEMRVSEPTVRKHLKEAAA